MTGTGPVAVGVVGAGHISTEYLGNLARFPDLDVRFVADLDIARARSQAAKFGVPASGTVDELLAIDAIEIVVNLTTPAVHAEVSRRIVGAGKHAWSEKPIALDRASGAALLAAAEDRGVRIAGAPDTFLGAGLQTAQRLVDAGRIGRPLSALAILQGPGPESWHPNPEFLFDIGAGPLFDMGPYYITALVQQLGPVRRVSAVSSTARPTRVIGSGPKAGREFPVNVPTQHAAILEFAAGGTAILLLSFESAIRRIALEITGTGGSLGLPDPNEFEGASVLTLADASKPETVAALGSTFGRGSGVLELARAIRAGVPERAAGRLAYHVLDVMVSVTEAAAERRPVEIESTTHKPDPLPVTWDPAAATL